MSEDQSTTNQPLPTYEKARLQAVANKQIRDLLNTALKPYAINATQWMILGVLKQGLANKTSDIAKMLGVEVPLITTLVQPLLASGLLLQFADERDKRNKPLGLSDGGEALVQRIDEQLTQDLTMLENGIGYDQLQYYFMTLQALIHNASMHPKPV